MNSSLMSAARPKLETGADTFSSVRRHQLSDIVRRSALRFPDRMAICCGETRWSYSEFDRLVSRLAAALRQEGLGAGDRVGILARNSHAFALWRFAVARINAVFVPINFMLKADEVAYILSHAKVLALACDLEHAELALAAQVQAPVLKHVFGLPSEDSQQTPKGMKSLEQLLGQVGSGYDPLEWEIDAKNGIDVDQPQTLAQIVYTSGTESLPKGAMLSHGAILSQYVSCVIDAEVRAEDKLLHALPLYHCAQLDVFFGPSIYVAAENIIAARPVPSQLIALIEQHQINSFFAPPTVWIGMLRDPGFSPQRLGSLRKAYYGASIMPVEVLKELTSRLPQVRFWNLYGQTEIAPLATMLQPEDQWRKAGSCGKPVLHVETRVVDDDMRDVVPGEVGEIVHRSPHLMQGYLDDPEKTAMVFRGGWFHSGDLAIIDEEGYITVVDRKKDMIKTGGENVASREVEEMIYRLSEVSEVAVVGLPDPKWVEAVTAFVVIKTGHQLVEQAVIEHCHRHLAGFKCPKRVFFVESLPKNPSGKILKRQLRDQSL